MIVVNQPNKGQLIYQLVHASANKDTIKTEMGMTYALHVIKLAKLVLPVIKTVVKLALLELHKIGYKLEHLAFVLMDILAD